MHTHTHTYINTSYKMKATKENQLLYFHSFSFSHFNLEYIWNTSNTLKQRLNWLTTIIFNEDLLEISSNDVPRMQIYWYWEKPVIFNGSLSPLSIWTSPNDGNDFENAVNQCWVTVIQVAKKPYF